MQTFDEVNTIDCIQGFYVYLIGTVYREFKNDTVCQQPQTKLLRINLNENRQISLKFNSIFKYSIEHHYSKLRRIVSLKHQLIRLHVVI